VCYRLTKLTTVDEDSVYLKLDEIFWRILKHLLLESRRRS
jgi:hypothetical protein